MFMLPKGYDFLMKKVLFFITMLCTIYLLDIDNIYADNASLTVSSDEKTVNTQDIVNVSIDIEADNSIKKIKAVVTYDKTLLEFQEGDSEVALDKEGYINIEDESKSGGRLRNYTLKFKAIKSGICKVSFDTVPELTDTSGDKLTVSFTPEYVEIKGAQIKDTDSTLKELNVSPGTLDKNFKKNNKNYKLSVPYDTEKLVIDAVANSKKAEVTIEGNKKFKVGSNKVKIKVKAEDDSTDVYTLTVTRMTEDEQFNYEREKNRELRKDLGTIYKKNNTLYIVNDNDYEILDIIETDNMAIPVGYKKASISLYGNSIEACVLEDDPKNDVFLIYAKNTDSGDEGYYQYDKVEKTLQRFFGETVLVGSEKGKKTFANNEYNDKLRVLGIVIGVLATLLIIAIGVVIKMAIDIRTIKNDNYLI